MVVSTGYVLNRKKSKILCAFLKHHILLHPAPQRPPFFKVVVSPRRIDPSAVYGSEQSACRCPRLGSVLKASGPFLSGQKGHDHAKNKSSAKNPPYNRESSKS